MSNYTKATNFLAKDSLASGDPLKVVRGSEIDAEFEAIETAVASKADQATTYTKTEVDDEVTAINASILAVAEKVDVETSYNSTTAPGALVSVTTGFTLNTGLAAGTVFAIYNNSASTITIAQGSGLTMRQGGTTLTGSRTIAARGLCTVVAVSTTEYILSGSGVA